MRPVKAVLAIAVLLCAMASEAEAQTNNPPDYARITTLEAAVTSGTATRAEQLELSRLYVQANRFYEASKIADRLLAMDANDAAAAKVRDDATRGRQAYERQKLADADAMARTVKTDHDRLALADAYFDAGSYGTAADTYAHLPPSALDRDARLRYARALAWSNQLDNAEHVYSALLNEQSTPELETEYGQVLSWMGTSKPAVDRLTDAYNKRPTEDTAIALANAMAWSGNRDGAIALLNNFTASHPNAVMARQLSQQMAASPDLRLERMSKLIESQPYNLALRAELAQLQYDAGHYAESLSTIKFIHEHQTRRIEAVDALEKQTRRKQKEELANVDAKLKALDAQGSMASSSNPDELQNLAKAYTGLGAYGRAETMYDRYLRLRPDDTNARIAYARVLNWDQRYDQADRQYSLVLATHPDRADLRLERAQVLSYEESYRPAMAEFALLTDKSNIQRPDLYPDVAPRAYFNLGQIYRWYGWNDTSAYEQQQALALDPGYVPARDELDLVRHLRPTSNLSGIYTYSHDSNDFTMRRLDLAAQKWTSPRTAWDVALGRHEFSLLDQDVYANAISGGANYRASDRVLYRGRVGANFYDEGLGTRPFGGVGVEFLPSIQSRASFDFNHYDLVYDVFTLQSLTIPSTGTSPNLRDALSINDFRGHYDYNTGGHWSWLADASEGFISDSNKRGAAHGELAFRIIKAPFVAIKGEGHYLAYDFRTNRYWSPTSYHSLAAVLQVGSNIHNRFFWTAEAKAGKAYEQGTSSDLRAYEAKATIPITYSIDFVADYGYGKSGRFDSLLGSTNGPTTFTNYWQRHFYVGLQAKRLFSHNDRARNPYYYDSRALAGASPVIPPVGESH
jgi:tetratricopeptide (TPR) repeat protein